MNEVWVLRIKADGKYIPPCLDDDGTDSFLAWPTKEQAEQGLEHQNKMGYLDQVNDDGGVEIVRIA